jgi:hypothetical protein
MLRLNEVASQSGTFSKRVLEKQKRNRTMLLPGPPRAGRLKSFLLTGRLYWLLGCAYLTRVRFSEPRACMSFPVNKSIRMCVSASMPMNQELLVIFLNTETIIVGQTCDVEKSTH